MDRTVHLGAIVQVNNAKYGPYIIFVSEIMERAVNIGAVFQNLDRTIEKPICSRKIMFLK